MYLFKKPGLVLACLLILVGPGIAQATLRALEEAYELSLAAITLPGNATGSLTVRSCATCKPRILRVNAQTSYVVRPNRSPVSLQDLKAQAGRITDRQRTAVYVYYDPRTGYVRRLVLDARP